MINLILFTLGLSIFTYSLTHVYRITAVALKILDEPGERSAHTELTPTGAGIVFVLIFSAVVWILSGSYGPGSDVDIILGVLPALLVTSLVGFVDDFHPVPWWLRLVVHVAVSGWIVFSLEFELLQTYGIVGSAVGLVTLVWLVNLYNFMDGIDAIAAGEAVFVLLSVCLMSLVQGLVPSMVALSLAGVCLGFLIINWPVARVFMGDAGSKFIGLVFGVLLLSETAAPIWAWLILLGWFLVDASMTVFIRFVRRERIQDAHSQHAYQHLNRSIGTNRTLFVVLLVNLFWLLPLAVYATINPEVGPVLLLLALTPLVPALYLLGAGQTSPGMLASK